jgi:hypothetical protein
MRRCKRIGEELTDTVAVAAPIRCSLPNRKNLARLPNLSPARKRLGFLIRFHPLTLVSCPINSWTDLEGIGGADPLVRGRRPRRPLLEVAHIGLEE